MRRLLLTAFMASALACGSAPTTRYYVLAPPSIEGGGSADEGSGAVEGVRLGVETFAVDPPYDQDRLTYRRGRESGEVGFYHHHRWASPPGRLVSTALVAGLRGTPGLAAVEPASVLGSYDLVLAGRVVSLEEIDLPGSQIARIQLDLKLLDPEADLVVWSGFFAAEAQGQAEEASDVMRQMQSAFSDVASQIREGLGEALRALD